MFVKTKKEFIDRFKLRTFYFVANSKLTILRASPLLQIKKK